MTSNFLLMSCGNFNLMIERAICKERVRLKQQTGSQCTKPQKYYLIIT